MKRLFLLVLILSTALCVNAFASLPAGVHLSPTPEDYANTDLSTHQTVYMCLVGDGEREYPDFPEILARVNDELADFNTTLDVSVVSWSDVPTLYPIILSGGDRVDLIFSATWRDLWSAAADSAFYPLDADFIRAYMPYTAQYQPEDSWSQVTYAGKIQGVTQNKTPQNASLVGIRTDLADDFGLSEDLRTWEDLVAYMLGIAAHTADNDIFAYNAGASDLGLASQFLRGSDLFYVGGNSWYCYSGTGSIPADVAFYYDSPLFADWVAEAKKLADVGCWSSSAAGKDESAAQSFQNGTGAVISWNFTIYQYMSYLETQVLGVEKMSATKGILLYPDQLCASEGYNNNVMCIAAATQDATRAAMVLDILKFNTDINTTLCLGIEGRHYTDLGDGFYENGPDSVRYAPFGMSWSWAVQNDNWNTKYDRDDANDMYSYVMCDLYVNPTMSFVFNPEPVSEAYAAVSEAIDEHRFALNFGLFDDADVALQEFRDALDQAGLDALSTEYLAQYQTWYAVQ